LQMMKLGKKQHIFLNLKRKNRTKMLDMIVWVTNEENSTLTDKT